MAKKPLNHTGEFFKKRDEWRKHPMVSKNWRNATPGLGTAIVLFGIYLFVDGMYSKISEKSTKHSH